MADAPTPVTLHHATQSADLNAALALVAAAINEETGTVMWWSPTAAHWQPCPCTPDEAAFELRAFDTEVEVRWLRSPTGGTLSVLATDSGRTSRPFSSELAWTSTDYATHLRSAYLLWGEVDSDGRLVDSRVGAVDLPVARPEPGRRYELVVVEYVAVDPESGTVYVAEERLLGVQAVTSGAQRTTSSASGEANA